MNLIKQFITSYKPLSGFIRTIFNLCQSLHHRIIKLSWSLFCLFPIDANKVIFSNFNGGPYGDNPKFIAEELIKQGAGLKLLWVSASKKYEFPCQIKTVRPNSLSFVYQMSTAVIWIDNTRKLYFFKKRREQYYIQTWHGGPGLKKVERDASRALSPEYKTFAKIDSANIDLFLSCCKWCSNLYHSSFWYNGPLLELGIPKNDMYFQDRTPIKNKIHEAFHLAHNKQLAIYAPTYRDNRSTSMYNLDYNRCIKALEKKLGGEWCFLVRLHPNVADQDGTIQYSDTIQNASRYENMQELLAAGDLIISDYSGCAFDYIVLERPGFLYAEDYEQVKKTKDYYFRLEELPFSLALDNDGLIQNIEQFHMDTYREKCRAYVDDIQFYDTGHASEAVAAIIKQKCGI